jgi:hypothetical protein
MATRKKASRTKSVKRTAKPSPRSQPRRKKPTKSGKDEKEGIVYSDVRREAAIRRLLR